MVGVTSCMKIIFLNTWRGEAGDPYDEFIREHAETTDIFCFQELDDDVERRTKDILSSFGSAYARKFGNDGEIRQATFFAPHLTLRSTERILPDDSTLGLGLVTELSDGARILHVCNFHGSPLPKDKRDDPQRIFASTSLIAAMRDRAGAKIIGGDFNLSPDTESVQMFERAGYVDHVQRNGIATTRNELAWSRYPDNIQKYADYVFTKDGVTVNEFVVPACLVSDHLPLIVDFDL